MYYTYSVGVPYLTGGGGQRQAVVEGGERGRGCKCCTAASALTVFGNNCIQETLSFMLFILQYSLPNECNILSITCISLLDCVRPMFVNKNPMQSNDTLLYIQVRLSKVLSWPDMCE